MTITVIGAGYVGLVTAAVFAHLGNKVFCIDIDKDRVEKLKQGETPFYEPSLSEYLQLNVKEKRLHFTTSYSESVPKSQVVFICVGTPPRQNGEADLSFLFSAVEETAKHLTGYTLITIKSTIPIGYEDDLEAIVKKHASAKYEFASAPEFLREGSAIDDTLHPDRIVIGSTSKKAQKILLELHAALPGERIVCDLRSAQLIKYAANAFLATKISFANALANICEKTGADVAKVVQGVGADKRIGRAFLYPGVGYGGSCLPKDVMAFIAQARNFEYDFELLRAVDAINSGQIISFINKIRNSLGVTEKTGKNLEGYRLAILGLAFKPNTDDMRDAPSIKIIRSILDLGGRVTAFDPKANDSAKKIMPEIDYAKDVDSCIRGKDAVVIVTEWPEFMQIDLQKAKKLLKSPIIIDGRNIIDPQKAREAGFSYTGIGR